MFTGLIEAVGTVAEVKRTSAGTRIGLTTALGPDLAAGDSVAVSGVCLTVVAANEEGFYADVSPETARVTTLGSIRRDAVVNLERPLRADARIGGHFVQGHVDGTGTLEEIRQDGDAYWITVRFPNALAPLIVRKGSVAVDGISLTVAGVDEHRFDVQIVPYTWQNTNLQAARPGNPLNLECDIIGKYVIRAAELQFGAKAEST